MATGRILIVEDEDKLRRVVQLHLEASGYEVDGAPTAEQALPLAPLADLIITDLRLPGMDGLELMAQVQSRGLQTAVIVITAHGSIDAAVEAMKRGAADFLQKPFSLDYLTTVVEKVMSVKSLREENRRMREQLDQRYQFDNIIGRSAAMREIFHTVERVAPTRATVLIAGESGVGKDMIARHSPAFASQPFSIRENQLYGLA
jgi:DNA-binding NtrC family response regulator